MSIQGTPSSKSAAATASADTLHRRAIVGMMPAAELVRRLIDRAWRAGERPTLGGFELSVGLWKRPDAAVAGRRPGIKLED